MRYGPRRTASRCYEIAIAGDTCKIERQDIPYEWQLIPETGSLGRAAGAAEGEALGLTTDTGLTRRTERWRST